MAVMCNSKIPESGDFRYNMLLLIAYWFVTMGGSPVRMHMHYGTFIRC